MKKPGRFGIIVITVMLVGVVLWLSRCDNQDVSTERNTKKSDEKVSNEGVEESYHNLDISTDVAKEQLASAFDELAGYGVSPEGVVGDLILVQNLIQTFHSNLSYEDALPTSGNKELMSVMLGKNRYGDKFVSSGFKFLNSSGEIVDRWGSPLIFHFETYECPDVRSIGPDKLPWTEDDIVSKY